MAFRCLLLLLLFSFRLSAQLAVARDSIMVIEAGRVLKMPWAGGLNYVNASASDLNHDGKKDLVIFDRMNQYGNGRFRCFINQSTPGNAKFIHDPNLSYFFPAVAYWAVLVDYNGDGKEDIFCSTSSGIKAFRNITSPQGAPAFALSSSLLMSDYNPGGSPQVTNLYASPVGKPAIADVDGDGRPDILTFSPLGTYVEFHRNAGPADSLHFELEEFCWGNISESGCGITLNACNGIRKSVNDLLAGKPMHAGSCMTCIDSDGDGDQDLLMGDVECDITQYAHNTGSSSLAVITDTTKLFPNFPNKNSGGVLTRMNNFPCTYVLDVDADGQQDLLASPNSFGSENTKSLWYYRNTSSTSTVNFQFVKKNLLQDEMIEVGQNAYPILMDVDADGLKDLLIGTYGVYDVNTLKSTLTLYRNIGTASQPAFSLVTRDYAGLGAESLFHIMPAAGDVDGDSDTDLLIGVSSGQVHWLENTAGAGNPCSFGPLKKNPFSFTTPSAEAAVQLFDLDKDGRLDIIVGMKNGRVAWYRNTSTGSTPAFSLQTATLGTIDVRSSPTVFGLDGYASPYFYEEAGMIRALVGSVTGQVFLYEATNGITAPFTLISSSVNGLNEGGQSTPYFDDVNGDGKRDLFLGNASGGVTFFSSASPFVSVDKVAPSHHVRWFPNPVASHLYFENPLNGMRCRVSDISGKVMKDVDGGGGTVFTGDLTAGMYFITLYNNEGSFRQTSKFVKE